MRRFLTGWMWVGLALIAALPAGARESMQRLSKAPAEDVVEYLTKQRLRGSLEKLFDPVSRINKAHVLMLAEQKIITDDEARDILGAVVSLETGPIDRLPWDDSMDLYMNVEKWVIERCGNEAGGKIHIGRSRNDLYATAHRMAVREEIHGVIAELTRLERQELALAEQHLNTVMPGYTHLQHAQPITFGHYLVGHAQAIARDVARLEQAHAFTNRNPLGAAALATTGFPIDRVRTTELLGFEEPMGNSLDAVASRDYVLDLLAGLSITMSDLSRLVEDQILWSTFEFGTVEIADEYASTSSIMPQKKNPTTLEYCRAKVGHVYGNLISALTMVKSLPFMHSSDTGTEIFNTVWPAIDETVMSVKLVTGVLSTLKVRPDLMEERAARGFSTATELADLIVKRENLSFRTAHHIVAAVVARAIEEGKGPDAVTLTRINDAAVSVIGRALNLTEADVQAALDPRQNVEARNILGGPAPSQVQEAIRSTRETVDRQEAALHARSEQQMESRRKLEEATRPYLR